MSFDSVYSPLLDSLVVSLKQSPNVIVVLNRWLPRTIKDGSSYSKNEDIKYIEEVKKHMLREAKQIEYYLRRKEVKNCIICNGNGYKIYYENKVNKAEEACMSAVQIILTTPGKWHCFSLEPDKPIVLHNIYFDTDKWDLDAKSFDELDLFASYLLNNPTIKIEISGHTDNTGDYKKNIELSQKRADAVASYLKTNYVKNSIEAKGYGSSKPFRTNDTESGRSQNRRIEVKIMK